MNKILNIFDKYPNLVIGFSTISDNNMRIRPSGSVEIDDRAKENRIRFLQSLGINSKSVVSPVLSHSNNVLIVSDADRGKTFENIDALITDKLGVFLNLTVADCMPIFLYNPEKNVISLVHVGWRGLENNILKNAITKLKEAYGSNPLSVIAGIGPHIGVCHYEIKDDVLGRFKTYPDAIVSRDNQNFLNLGAIAQTQLTNLGLKPGNIEVNSECTLELRDKYFSFRRDKPEIIETMLAVFGMKY